MAINPALITTIRVGELSPDVIDLNSKIPVENGTDLFHVTGQDIVNFMNVNANSLQFEIRDLWVSQSYIDTNFDNTGLGTLLCEGYAICNGQNGTPNLDGLVSIGYGTNYNVIKAVGGSKNAVVVSHTHTFTGSEDDTANDGGFILVSPTNSIGTKSILSTEGVSGTNKNMQPYMVLLKIMKL
ncbi:MAG: Flavobacterium phage 11b [Bacteroidota bacterium]|jgi:hypothetical protein